MNTLGCHTPTLPFTGLRVPYVHTVRFVDICHWMTPTAEDFLDVYSPAFGARCDRLAAEEAASRRNDAFLLGYTMTDCPIFTRLDAAPRARVTYGKERGGTPTWPDVLRNLGGESPGKRAYVDLMREAYGEDISAFNATYATRFGSFEDLRATAKWASGIDLGNATQLRDHDQFLARIVERYYQVTTEALRRHDPNHLVLGDKLNGNTGVPDELVSIAARHVDVLFYQFYAYYREQEPLLDRWSQLTDKPLLNGDSSYSVPDDRMPDPNGPHCPDQEERARQFTRFARQAFSRPDFVGWHWCGWIDRWQGYHRDARHSGLQDPYGRPYVPMQQAMADLSARMYAIALGVD